MKTCITFLMVAVLTLSLGCSGGGKTEEDKKTSSEVGSNPLNAPTDYLGAVGQAQKTAETSTALNSVRQAVRFYQASEGTLPKSLEELVSSGYIGKLPSLPKGKSFQYQPNTGQVSVQ